MRAVHLIPLGMVILGLLSSDRASSMPHTARTRLEPQIGPVLILSVDRVGDGWGWASALPRTPTTSFLLRLQQGTWQVAADHTTAPSLLPSGLVLRRMAITADGSEGWAIGATGADVEAPGSPVLWRLHNGSWGPVPINLAPALSLIDLTLSADGSDGWITGLDENAHSGTLLRLREGRWHSVAEPNNGRLLRVALSADGRQAWALGWATDTGSFTAWRLIDGSWKATYKDVLTRDYPSSLAADNAGNVWMVAGENGDVVTHDDVIMHFSTQTPPRVIALIVPGHSTTAPGLRLHQVALAGDGRGWIAGGIVGGIRSSPVLIRLQGETAQAIDPKHAGIDPVNDLLLQSVATSADGAHSWLGTEDQKSFGHLRELHEPWSHSVPTAAAPLPGVGRCFIEVPYCLHGAFLHYWEQHGGLVQLGFPVTPEIQESHGPTTYTVQYTERARLEYHPENTPPYDVELGLLANSIVDSRLKEVPFEPTSAHTAPGYQWFAATEHNVGPPFLAYWQAQGGLRVFGLPRSEAFTERNAADGKTYLVQYFERARLEYHPEHEGTPYEFLLGLLGVEHFTRVYGYPP